MSGSTADRARGLVDGNELAETPGALSIAENVVVEPGGTLAVRPTFTLAENVSAIEQPRTIVSAQGIPGYVYLDADGVTLRYHVGGTDVNGPQLALPTEWYSGAPLQETPWFEARTFTYLCGNVGWQRVTRNSVTAAASFFAAGLDVDITTTRLYLMGTSVGTGWEAPPWTGLVAYRLAVRRTLVENGSYVAQYVQFSVPSGRYVCEGNLIGGTNAAITGADRYYFRGLRTNDTVQWYRTRGSGGPTIVPAASHFLVCEYTITDADVAAGYFHNTTITYDTVPDDDLGAALYTNPERDGIEKAKYPPPIANTGALFGRCSWYGDTLNKQRLNVSLRSVGTVYDFTGTTTIGTDTITAVPSVTGLAVGQFVTDSQTTPRTTGVHFPARTRIVAITGAGPYTVQVSEDASASSAGYPFAASNWIDPSIIAREGTGTVASGTNTITGVANVTGLFVGMFVWDSGTPTPFTAGTRIPASTQITSISGAGPYTIGISNNATGSGSTSLRFGDWLYIGSTDLFVASPVAVGLAYGPGTPFSTYTRVFGVVESGAGSTLGAEMAGAALVGLAQAINYQSRIAGRNYRAIVTGADAALGGSIGAFTSGDFTIEEYGIGGSAIGLSTNPNSEAHLAVWPTGTAGLFLSSNPDRKPNRVYWSAPDEPEAVPVVNFVDLASSTAVLQRLVPLRAALLAFTTEGLYRISGVAPDAWSADLIDPSIRLVTRESVAVIDNVAYAWTTRGVIAVDEASFVDVSTGAVGKRLDAYMRATLAVELNESGQLHQWVATWKAQNLVLVGCTLDGTTDPVGPGETAEIFVYNTISRAWSTWPVTYRRFLEVAGVLWGARGDRFITVRSAEAGAPTSVGYDLSWPVATWVHSTGTTAIDINPTNYAPWRPRVGDYFLALLSSGSYSWRRIVAFGDTTPPFVRFIVSRPFSTADDVDTLDAYEVASVDLEWTPATAGTLQGYHQRWREGCVTLDVSGFTGDGEETSTLSNEAEPGFGATTSMVVATVSRKVERIAQTRTLPVRFAVPRSVARASVLWPRFKMAAIGWPARIYGVVMQRLGASEKVHR